jgi:AcrR family transcriptional regulator
VVQTVTEPFITWFSKNGITADRTANHQSRFFDCLLDSTAAFSKMTDQSVIYINMPKRAISDAAKAVKRQLILDAALSEFYEKGFTAARMDDIATRCDLSKGTVYLYFSSKEDLFNGLIETIAKPNQAKLISLMSGHTSATQALHALTEFMPQVIARGQLPRLMKIIIGDSGAFPEIVRQYREQVIEQALAALTSLFERSNQRGETTLNDPALFARLVVAPVLLSAVWKAVFAEGDELGFDVQQLFSLHRRVLLNALHIDREETP